MLSLLCGLGAIVFSCREPTSILIEARTNVVFRPGYTTTFTVGAPGGVESADPTTVSDAPWAADGFIGSLTTIPSSGDSALVSLKVVLGVRRDSRECKAPAYDGCIVTRRRLRYVEHERLRLPVTLYASCEGVPCDEDSTCNQLGQCVSSLVDPKTCDTPSGCQVPGDRTTSPPGPVAPQPDSGGDADATVDAGDGASAFDGGADASDGGSDPDGGGMPSGSVSCPPVECTGDNPRCCAGTTYRCLGPTELCGPSNTILRCDDSIDCAPGSSCCVYGTTVMCLTGGCPLGSKELCTTRRTCSLGTCSAFPNLAGAYYTCE